MFWNRGLNTIWCNVISVHFKLFNFSLLLLLLLLLMLLLLMLLVLLVLLMLVLLLLLMLLPLLKSAATVTAAVAAVADAVADAAVDAAAGAADAATAAAASETEAALQYLKVTGIRTQDSATTDRCATNELNSPNSQTTRQTINRISKKLDNQTNHMLICFEFVF